MESVQSQLRRLEELQGLDEGTKTKLRELYQQTLKDLEAANGWAADASRFEQMLADTSNDEAQIRSELDEPPRPLRRPIPDASLAQLEQTLSQKEGELAERKAELAELEAEPNRRSARRVEIPKRVATAREQLDQVANQYEAMMADADESELAVARRQALLARRQSLEQELLSYSRELKAYEVRADLLPLRRDLAAHRVALAEQELSQWREAVNRRRQHEAQLQLKRTQWEAKQAHPAVAELTRTNALIAQRRQGLAELIVRTTTQLDDANQKLATLEEQFQRSQDKVDTVGLTNAIGLMLRNQREAMPDVRRHRRNQQGREPAIRDSQWELIKLQESRSELANLPAQVENELRLAGYKPGQPGRSELEEAVRNALETKRECLDGLIVDLSSYFDTLVDLDNAERRLAERAVQYANYIDERVLWIRSTSVFGVADVHDLAQAAFWLVEPEAWLQLAGGLLLDVRSNPLFAALALLLFGPLIWHQPALRRRISQIGETAKRANCCSVLLTLEVILLTVLLTSVVPGLLWYVAWRLNVGVDALELSKAVSAGLVYTAGVYLVLDLLQQMCRPNGLSEAHFDWPASALKPLRQYMRGAKVLVLPLVFIAVTLNWQNNDIWADSLGRFSFVAAMLACALLVQRALRPDGGIYQALLAERQGGWVDRLRFVWYPLAVLVPLTLALLGASGYYYTSEQLAQRMVTSAYVLWGLALLRSFLLRWVLVKRRKLAMEQARQRRAASQAESKTTGECDMSSIVPIPAQPNLDLAKINVQTRHFIEYSLAVTGFLGIWLVWVDVLPALGILDRIPVWQGAEQAEPVSLADFGLAALIAITTMIAAKNIPGLLELAVLQRLPLEPSVRYTIGTVSRYAITVVGLLVTCHTLGLGWTKVQWLIAAVSVGLGFGLQEIFANFVSGLIVLFERPVRVGDVVTVADVTGVISRIRMRATTITNWDRKEFIVPNKEFITGRLLNWTLSDQINRVVVQVGVAYGSDTELAGELIMKVARENPLVMTDPPPRVSLEEFGASSLNYVLRCYLPDLENRTQVVHDLHMGIDREFRRAGIEIAFPQQDIHIRSIDAGLDLLDRSRIAEPQGRRFGPSRSDDGQSRQVA